MTTVAITGVGGLVGRRLVATLGERDDVSRIIGLDITEPEGLYSPKLVFRRADVRDADLGKHLEGVDAVVHLAFQLDPLRDEVTMRSINVHGTKNVFESAVRAGVSKVIYLSSGVVYGAHPDNDFPLTEDSPLRANPDFNYAEHKLEVERWLAGWLPEQEGLVATIFRLAIIAGPGVENFISRQIEALRFVGVKGYRPPWQFAHVDDVAAAISLAVEQDLDGAYNLASEGWISWDEALAIIGRDPVEVPSEVAFTMTDRLWQFGLGEGPPGMVHYVMHPWVMSVDRLRDAGWAPKHSNRDALAELMDEHADWLALPGGLRFRRSRAKTVAAVLGAALGVAAVIALRGRDDEAEEA